MQSLAVSVTPRLNPQPQKHTHPHQARWKVVSHPHRQHTRQGSLHHCFLTWAAHADHLGQLEEIIMPGSYPQGFRQKWPGVWTEN